MPVHRNYYGGKCKYKLSSAIYAEIGFFHVRNHVASELYKINILNAFAVQDVPPSQVKRSDNIGRNVIDNFKSAVERYDKKLFDKNVACGKPAGYIIAFSFGKGAIEEVARLKLKENIIINLVKVEDIVPIARKPALTIEITKSARTEKEVREIEFTAKGASEAGIEFYSWDFDYSVEKGFKASVMIDREGRQTAKFKAGLHSVAVKVVDNDGLENIETIKLKVNGTVERQ